MKNKKKDKMPVKLAWNLCLCWYDGKEFVMKVHDVFEAVQIFIDRYGHSPEKVSLLCSINENTEFVC